MHRSLSKNTNSGKFQDSIPPYTPISSPTEMFLNEMNKYRIQDTEFKRSVINSIKEFEELKEDTEKQLSGFSQRECI